MNQPGVSRPSSGRDLLVASRAALLDALEALEAHRDAVIVIGAQAIYLRTPASPVAVAEVTKDSDLAIDPRELLEDPKVEEAMTRAGFYADPLSNNPGAWMSPAGVPVDLMVPEAVAGPGGRNARGARIPPHSDRATRRAVGLEAALVDSDELDVSALDPGGDGRTYRVRVAGLAALLVAKLHKIGERADKDPRRLNDKDAHDIYRILVGSPTEALSKKIEQLRANELSRDVTIIATDHLRRLFASPEAMGSVMAGRAEQGVGDPDFVSQSVSFLASDLIAALDAD